MNLMRRFNLKLFLFVFGIDLENRALPRLTYVHHGGERNLFLSRRMQVALRGGTSLCVDNFSMSHFEQKRASCP